MAWDDAATNMAVNVIAKVEGSGAWDAINYHDPITIGLMQWYGTRAAGLLSRIKTDHPDQYANIDAGLRADHSAHPDSNRWWTTRYLTGAEGKSLKPVLRASKDTQSALVKSDVEDYLAAAVRIGMNKDTNTNAVIYFMVMYHQTPARAINIVRSIGPSSNIDRLYAASMNDGTFSRYKTYRYKPAYDYIKSGVAPEIIDLNDDDSEIGDDTNNTPQDNQSGDITTGQVDNKSISRIMVFGDSLHIYQKDGTHTIAVPSSTQNFVVKQVIKGSDIPAATPDADEEDDNPDPNPDPPTGNDVADKQNAIIKFMTDRIGRYRYSQAGGRLSPDKYGYTDCSGLVRYAYLSIMKIDVGTYTDAQLSSKTTKLLQSGGGGTSPNPATMQKGDLVITRRYGTAANRAASHIELYMGNGKIIGHGGPMNGPIIKDLAARTADKQRWYVKRLTQFM